MSVLRQPLAKPADLSELVADLAFYDTVTVQLLPPGVLWVVNQELSKQDEKEQEPYPRSDPEPDADGMKEDPADQEAPTNAYANAWFPAGVFGIRPMSGRHRTVKGATIDTTKADPMAFLDSVEPDEQAERPGFVEVCFPVGWGELREAKVFAGMLLVAFDRATFAMGADGDWRRIDYAG